MRKKRISIKLKSKHLLVVLGILCFIMILGTFTLSVVPAPIRNTVGVLVTPFQNGVNRVGGVMHGWASGFSDVQKLQKENEELQSKIDDLTEKNNRLIQSQEELKRLEELYKLDQEYPEYTKVAASVIAKDPGNWYSTFVINKGAADGLKVNMNVISGGGLVGIITETGEHWSKVRSIIDDENNISGMIATTSDTCIVSGNLASMTNGRIDFSELRDRGDVVAEGTSIVTSNISTQYLTGLLIGYIAEVGEDSNHLTKYGTIIPAADFKNIREVLVIQELKQTKENS
ncbi:MAG TPA: rod shape-determining protein MreC [Lachnospiraceae bacterium]|nr:rod shape-determining protein MreC [Lachnospiraceae bacterium]